MSLLGGAAGGNIAGAVLKNLSLGTLWNSVSCVVGGGLGGKIPSLGAVAVSKTTGLASISAPSSGSWRAVASGR